MLPVRCADGVQLDVVQRPMLFRLCRNLFLLQVASGVLAEYARSVGVAGDLQDNFQFGFGQHVGDAVIFSSHDAYCDFCLCGGCEGGE